MIPDAVWLAPLLCENLRHLRHLRTNKLSADDADFRKLKWGDRSGQWQVSTARSQSSRTAALSVTPAWCTLDGPSEDLLVTPASKEKISHCFHDSLKPVK